MILSLEESRDDATAILRHPEIYAVICDDGAPAVDQMSVPDGWTSVVAYVDDVPAGCFVLHPTNSITMECHLQILPEFRKHSTAIGKAVIEWAWKNTKAQKLTANIPMDCENVKLFAQTMGFKVEGINENSIMKNGKILSQWYMGLKKWA